MGFGVADAQTVHVHHAGFHRRTDLDLASAHLKRLTVIEHKDMILRNAHLTSQCGVRTQMHCLAMDRHEVRGLSHSQHELELFLAAVARNMHERARLVVYIAAELRQTIDDLLDGLLVTRNGGWPR